MLKSVVENDHVCVVLGDGLLSRDDAIGVLQLRHVGQRRCDFASFVIRAATLSVTAADQRDRDVPLTKPLREPNHKRSFTRAADG